jgi:anthranilate phosphoribosyltransferase
MAEQTQDVKPLIQRVVEGYELSVLEAATALDVIMTGNATPAQVGALLTALRMRGETVAEIAGFARTMRKHAIPVHLGEDPRPVVDTCGTGGDAAGTFNISTTAAFVVAGAGVRVAKHGNRSMTSRCGSADVLEGLGVKITLGPEAVSACINQAGVGFMFAQAFHPAMRFVGPVRREIGVRTVFNILGPLTNPAGVKHQLIGVSDGRIARALAEVLALLGSERVLLATSHDGLDEIGISGPTDIVEYDVAVGHTRTYSLDPIALGLEPADRTTLLGGAVGENVSITRAILGGEGGPRRTVTLINAGAALYTAGAADSIERGVAMAAEAIDTGKAMAALEHLVDLSNSLPDA